MRTANTPIQITIPNKREPISGIVNTAMARGSRVMVKSASQPVSGDQRELVTSDGTGTTAFLERDVLSLTDFKTYCKQNPAYVNDILHPVPVGSAVSARFAHEVEVEGTDHFDGITGSSTPGTAVVIAAGKFAPLDDEAPARVHGYLGRKVTPHDSTTFRWAIDMLG